MNEDEVRDNLMVLVTEAANGEAFTITRDGEPVAVLIGAEEYALLGGEVGDS